MACEPVHTIFWELFFLNQCTNPLPLSLYSTATQNHWLKFALSPTPNLKFVLHPTLTPDASQWNIGSVGPSVLGLALGKYISGFLCQFHLRLVANANAVFSGIGALIIFL